MTSLLISLVSLSNSTSVGEEAKGRGKSVNYGVRFSATAEIPMLMVVPLETASFSEALSKPRASMPRVTRSCGPREIIALQINISMRRKPTVKT